MSLFFCVLWGRETEAAPTSAAHAQNAVAHWIARGHHPMGAKLGTAVRETQTALDADGQPVYHVVYLTEDGTSSAGYVIVSGDDEAEPIVAFCSGDRFDPSTDTPLGALVAADLPTRIALVRQAKPAVLKASSSASEAKRKWETLEETTTGETSSASISDVRVAPLVMSKWDQTTVNGAVCYNYYTPNSYPSGCVATALSQLLRFYQYPTVGVGVKSYSITVNSSAQSKYLRGGNGSGGAYDWANMPLVPTSGVTSTQRAAIGALLYDAGLSVNMDYESGGSGADTLVTKNALVNTFFYSNAIKGYNNDADLGSALVGMVNPNLDAGFPVLFGIVGSPGGHAIVCDGYGYNSSTLYHHLNMGWSGDSDAWYALPTIDSSIGTFTTIYKCTYNVFVTGSGEIISGRVTDSSANPLSGATVSAVRTGGSTYTATTGSNGIFALAKIPSSSSYTVSVSKTGYTFNARSITVGKSTDFNATSGNIWGVDFADGNIEATNNDNFANAWLETGESWTSTGSNVGMTREPNEPRSSTTYGGHSAWWVWTAPISWTGAHTVTVSTEGSSFDTTLACYTGTKVSSLTWIASNDDAGTGVVTSKMSFSAVPGTTYHIAVDGKSFDGGVTAASGAIVLTLTGPSTIATSASPTAGGSTAGGGTYTNGSSVTVTATPNTGYLFTSWTEGGITVSSSSAYTFTASTTRTLVANFQQTPWTAWESAHFSAAELSNPAICGPLQNPEGDGICNLLKYAFNLERQNPNRSALPQIAMENGYLALTYVSSQAATDLTYTVEVSSDLKTWNSGPSYTSSPVLVSDNGTTQTLKVTDLTPASGKTVRFMRLRVTGP